MDEITEFRDSKKLTRLRRNGFYFFHWSGDNVKLTFGQCAFLQGMFWIDITTV
jgi:hypothetical protein